MSQTYDLSTEVGQVRLLIGDVDVSGTCVFSDEDIAFFVGSEATVKLAGAAALEAIAASKARVAIMQQTLNYMEDARMIVKGLLDAAARLRGQDSESPCAGVAEVANTPWAEVDISLNRMARGGE